MLPLQALAKIKVTSASLFENNQLNTPASVTIIQEQDWLRGGARRLVDSFQHLASVYSTPWVFAGNGVAIRGLPIDGRSGVLTTLDGIPIPDFLTGNALQPFAMLNLGTLSSIEVVRGPGSALHGSDAFHGVISLQSFAATEDMASVNGLVASDNYYQSTARASRQIGQAGRLNVALAVNGQGDQHLPYSSPDASGVTRTGERDNNFSAQSLAMAFNSDANDAWSYVVGAYAHRLDANRFFDGGAVPRGDHAISDTQSEFYLARLGLTKRFTEHASLTVGSYYWTLDSRGTRFLSTPSGYVQTGVPIEQHRAGLRAIYRDQWAEHTQWAVVAGVVQAKIDSAKDIAIAQSGVVLRNVDQMYAGTQRIGKYLTFEGETIFDARRFAVTYGARLDTYSDVDKHLSPRLGLIYHPQSDTALKLLYGHGFRAPVALETHSTLGVIQGDPNLDPETFDSVELVWLRQAGTWSAQATAFHSVLRDGIEFVVNPTPPPATRAVNRGTSTADGVELEYQWQVNAWRLRSDATYIKTDNNVTGSFTTIPKWVATLVVGYALPAIRSEFFVTQRVQAAVDDVTTNFAYAPTHLPVYWRVDATASTRLANNFKLWLSARNLFDRGNRVRASPPSQFGLPDESLSVGLGVGYDF